MAGGLVSLGMIGGFLHQKTPEIVSEYLPVAKMLDGGSDLGDIMSRVMQSGGLQGVMSNPVGALSGQLQGTISQGLGSLSGLPGVGSLVSSLTGPGSLSESVGNLTSTAGSLLSGQGVLGMLSHSSIVGLAGSALPSGLSLDRVVAPLFSQGMLSYVDSSVSAAVSGVVAGSTSVADAVSLVQGYASSVQSLVDSSRYALNTVAGFDVLGATASVASDISAVHAVASVLATANLAATAPQLLADTLSLGLSADDIQQMVDSVATH